MDQVFVHRDSSAPDSGSGPLRGLRMAIQPNLSVAGWPTDAGSKALSGFTALEDATAVRRLRQAGAWLCGSIRMSEFGLGLRGSRAGGAVAAGPSGAAVEQQEASGAAAERGADAELVLDLMGESRLAAARAGVCGFKPSWGLVSRFGQVGLIPSMECCGVISRRLDQVRGILQAITGDDGLDYSLPDEGPPDFTPGEIDPKRTTIGVITEASGGLPQTEGLPEGAREMQEAGFRIH